MHVTVNTCQPVRPSSPEIETDQDIRGTVTDASSSKYEYNNLQIDCLGYYLTYDIAFKFQ